MSDQQEQPASTTSTPGELLRQERELQGRTVQQVAGDLHIGAYMVEAIENNQFGVLGAPVFARGHLRKYAGLLGLSVERVQQLYQNLSDRPRDQDPVPNMHRGSEPSIPMGPDSKTRRTLQRPAKWTIVIAGGALVLAAIVAWILHSGSKPAVEIPEEAPSEAPAISPTVSPPVSPTVSQAPQSEPARNPPANTNPTTTSVDNNQNGSAVSVTSKTPVAEKQTPALAASVAPSGASTPAVSPTPAAAGRKVRLRFSFTQESWVEVYDSRGTRLLYDVGFPGQTRSVDVDPPAQVVLGQATAVSTEANGRALTVPPRRIANQVARFTVGTDGSAQ